MLHAATNTSNSTKSSPLKKLSLLKIYFLHINRLEQRLWGNKQMVMDRKYLYL